MGLTTKAASLGQKVRMKLKTKQGIYERSPAKIIPLELHAFEDEEPTEMNDTRHSDSPVEIHDEEERVVQNDTATPNEANIGSGESRLGPSNTSRPIETTQQRDTSTHLTEVRPSSRPRRKAAEHARELFKRLDIE